MLNLKSVLVSLAIVAGSSAYAEPAVSIDEADEVQTYDLNALPQDEIMIEPFARTSFRCVSNDFQPRRCPVRGWIQSVAIVRQHSYAPCVAGTSWGATRRFVWVSRGCDATFVVRYQRY